MKNNVFDMILAFMLGILSVVFVLIIAVLYLAVPLAIAFLIYKFALSLWPPTPTTPQTTTAAERLLSSCFCYGAQYFICLITKDMQEERLFSKTEEAALVVFILSASIMFLSIAAIIIKQAFFTTWKPSSPPL